MRKEDRVMDRSEGDARKDEEAKRREAERQEEEDYLRARLDGMGILNA